MTWPNFSTSLPLGMACSAILWPRPIWTLATSPSGPAGAPAAIALRATPTSSAGFRMMIGEMAAFMAGAPWQK